MKTINLYSLKFTAMSLEWSSKQLALNEEMDKPINDQRYVVCELEPAEINNRLGSVLERLQNIDGRRKDEEDCIHVQKLEQSPGRLECSVSARNDDGRRYFLTESSGLRSETWY